MGEDAVLERLVLLETVRDIFSNTDHFEDLSLNDRKKICGLVKFQDGINWELFGHLKTNRISFVSFDEKKQIISQGLDAIPLSGDINGQYYTSFIDKFKDFSVTKQVLIASRLLTMKRPDYFVTRTKTNSPELNKHLLNSINEGESDYHQYYNKIICQIHESDWWSSSKPTDDLELRIWNCRTAMLDLIFYRKPE